MAFEDQTTNSLEIIEKLGIAVCKGFLFGFILGGFYYHYCFSNHNIVISY